MLFKRVLIKAGLKCLSKNMSYIKEIPTCLFLKRNDIKIAYLWEYLLKQNAGCHKLVI